MKRTITFQPAEKHVNPGQIKMTIEYEIDSHKTDSTTVYIPEALFVLMPSMIDSYVTKPQKMSANVLTDH